MTTTIDAATGPAMGVNRFEALQKATPTFKPSRAGQQRALEAAIWPSRPRVTGRQSFAGAVRAEWIKLRSLTSTWVTSAITIAITVLFGAGLAMGFAGSPDRADQAKTMIAAGSVLGLIVVAVLGALMMTSEYASGQIRSSMMAVPRRGRLFTAKALVGSAFSFVLGVLSVALAYAASYPFMKGHAGSLTDTHYLGLIWGTGLSFAVVALTALFKTFVIQWFEIPSGSMENTLEVGDEVAVTMYDAQDLERGDVVVFTDPDHWLDVEDPTGLRGVIRDTLVLIHLLPENTGHYLIKRVIGVAGDHIVADGRGSLTVNGAPLDETYLKNGTSPSEVAFDVVVPEGFVWVMGDNRSNSADSRYHQDDAHGGFVPIDDVAGVAKVVVWPIGHWRGLGDGHEAFKDVPEPGRAPAPAAPAPEDGA